MQRDHVDGFRLQCQLLFPQANVLRDLLVLLPEVRAVTNAVDQELRDALQPFLTVIDLGDQRGTALHHLGRKLLTSLVVVMDELDQHFRIGQLLAQAVEDAFLHAVEVIGLRVRAGPAITMP
nr:hypothetical protein [uncultured Agrobacterium sp.]